VHQVVVEIIVRRPVDFNQTDMIHNARVKVVSHVHCLPK
jgi:hypothetical protein